MSLTAEWDHEITELAGAHARPGLSQRAAGLRTLSRRELEVLALMAEGLSNLGVATRLSLTPKTVDSHVRSIFHKLDLRPSSRSHRRVQAVLVYLADRAGCDGGQAPRELTRREVALGPAPFAAS